MNIFEISLISKALSDANRLHILKMLTTGEKCACKLLEEFQITQPTLSHHMSILCKCGLVNVVKDGKWSHYSLNEEVMNEYSNSLNEFKVREGIINNCK